MHTKKKQKQENNYKKVKLVPVNIAMVHQKMLSLLLLNGAIFSVLVNIQQVHSKQD